MNSTANRLRRWSRNVHRELSFFFSGMLLIYAVSGLVMNHRDTINPNYSVEQRRYVVGEPLPARDRLTRDDVVRLLAPLDEADNYTKHYFPESDVLKVFLKGGSSLTVRLSDGEAFYEKLTRRPVLGAMTRLHYNPGRWWTWFRICSPWDSWRSSQAACCCSRGRRGFGDAEAWNWPPVSPFHCCS